MTPEARLIRQIMLAHGASPGVRLFRNNTGQAWAGKAVRVSRATTIRVEAGDVIVRQARPLHAGLAVGSPDLVGWKTEDVTKDMVGQSIARFVGIEAKTGRLKATAAQARFLSALEGFGGLALVARSVDDVAKRLDGDRS